MWKRLDDREKCGRRMVWVREDSEWWGWELLQLGGLCAYEYCFASTHPLLIERCQKFASKYFASNGFVHLPCVVSHHMHQISPPTKAC